MSENLTKNHSFNQISTTSEASLNLLKAELGRTVTSAACLSINYVKELG